MNYRKNKKIKIILFEANMTQRDLSRKTRIPENFISLIVNGKYNPTPEEKTVIAEALNISANKIF
jgi:transcriptional regulator with XRE-family HTH domain